MPKMIKIHVTYGETKRVISHQKGGEVQGLRHTFLQVFSDVLSSEIAPAHVTFQRYDDKFEDYVELQNNERLEDDIKIRALISKQVLIVVVSDIFNFIWSYMNITYTLTNSFPQLWPFMVIRYVIVFRSQLFCRYVVGRIASV